MMRFFVGTITAVFAIVSAGCLEPSDPRESPFDQAVATIGGRDALTSLENLQVDATGTRLFSYESLHPGENEDLASYTTTYTFDLQSGDVRFDTERQPLFEALQFAPPETFSIVVNSDIGGLSAQAGFTPPGNLPSQVIGSIVTGQRLLNPHFYLREGIADASLALDGGFGEFEGRAHRLIHFDGEVAEISLFVDDQTGVISKLETLESSVLLRDIALEVHYSDWQSYGSLSFPGTVEVFADGDLVQEETRSAVNLSASFSGDHFDLPPDPNDNLLDPDAFAFGQQTHEAVDQFFNLGLAYNEQPPFMSSELVPGVTLFATSHNSMAISYDQGLVVLEAPLAPAHGSNLVAALDTAFPGEPITHVIQSHYHQDHSSGLRSFVAAGATAVVGNGIGAFYDSVFAAPSTIRPDALSAAGVTPTVNELDADGSLVISDANVTITAYHVATDPHSADMIITTIDSGGERFVYVSDLYNAGFGVTLVLGGPEAFFAHMRDLGIIDASCASAVPLTIVPSHGVPQSLADSITEVTTLGLDVGCP